MGGADELLGSAVCAAAHESFRFLHSLVGVGVGGCVCAGQGHVAAVAHTHIHTHARTETKVVLVWQQREKLQMYLNKF